MTVYVLHFEPAYCHARHYVGFTEQSFSYRLNDHLNTDRGSPLVRAALAAGCRVDVAMVWHGAGRDFERFVKDQRQTGRWCPLCGRGERPVPDPERITPRFRAKPRRFTADAV